MNHNPYIIDLEDFRTKGAKVFTTRPRGIQVRNDSRINEIEPTVEQIVIRIPADISSINPSFLEEFFETVVLRLGEADFYKKFSFINEGSYKIDTDLAEAVERIMREESAIA
jgi:hypothetical protein